MTTLFAVENPRDLSRTYFKQRWLALTRGKKLGHAVFQVELADDSVLRLLNGQSGLIANSVQIYAPGAAAGSKNPEKGLGFVRILSLDFDFRGPGKVGHRCALRNRTG